METAHRKSPTAWRGWGQGPKLCVALSLPTCPLICQHRVKPHSHTEAQSGAWIVRDMSCLYPSVLPAISLLLLQCWLARHPWGGCSVSMASLAVTTQAGEGT